eukprot:TRINITY_DN260_c1_g1_i1.p1 TRINITY_DN260_c1_g1~~TRINITY_DN260_c1_g1_i1.p1  ORF type:complete len:270 (+),score=54.52 TRINITY_DN260_c1_g1_i1:104-913(+)
MRRGIQRAFVSSKLFSVSPRFFSMAAPVRSNLRLGIIKCDDWVDSVVEKHGDIDLQYSKLLSSSDPSISTKSFSATKGVFPTQSDIDELDGFVITGSKFSAYEDQPWINQLKDFVRQLDSRQKKVLGVCFGHQVAAEALGGKVEKVGWNMSHETVKMNDAVPELKGELSKDSLDVLCIHQDQVTKVPPGCTVWGSNEACSVQGFVKGQHLATIQAHPEFTGAVLRDLILSKKHIPSDVVDRALETVDLPTDSKHVADWAIKFFSSGKQA